MIALLKSVLGQSRVYRVKGSAMDREALVNLWSLVSSPWPTSDTVMIGGLLFYLLFSTVH